MDDVIVTKVVAVGTIIIILISLSDYQTRFTILVVALSLQEVHIQYTFMLKIMFLCELQYVVQWNKFYQ